MITLDAVRAALDALGPSASLRQIRAHLGDTGSLETISELRRQVLAERGLQPPSEEESKEAPAAAPPGAGVDMAAVIAQVAQQVLEAVQAQLPRLLETQGAGLAAHSDALIPPALRAGVRRLKRDGLGFDAFMALLRDFGRATRYQEVLDALIAEGTLTEGDRSALAPMAVPPTPAAARPAWAPECDCPSCPPHRKSHWICCGCRQRYPYALRVPYATRLIAVARQGDPLAGVVLASACSTFCLDKFLLQVPQTDDPGALERRLQLHQRIARAGAWGPR
jgi:hypothetical protein